VQAKRAQAVMESKALSISADNKETAAAATRRINFKLGASSSQLAA
jgi:hypothetical protein